MALGKERLKIEISEAKRGNVEAIGRVYDHYTFGNFDEDKSRFWLRRLAEVGQPASQYNLGQDLIEEGHVTSGMEWVKKAATAHYDPAVIYMKRTSQGKGVSSE